METNMTEHAGDDEIEAFIAWKKKQLNEGVEEMMRIGVVTGTKVEARVVWSLPHKLLIGQLREPGQHDRFTWLIVGEFPTDHLDSSVAITPREAARHFALKWHLEAARYQDLARQDPPDHNPRIDWDDIGQNLAGKAEALYAVVDDDQCWPEGGGS